MGVSKQKITCVIPAYNEAKTIGGVIKSCLSCKLIDEIVVVNDGSKDDTAKKVAAFKNKVKLINLTQNKGKGNAVVEGIEAASGDVILMLDSDLINIKEHHIYSLIEPVINRVADMTIGNLMSYEEKMGSMWQFSGQRSFWKKDVGKYLKKIRQTKYGLEVFLNEIYSKKRIVVVPLVFPNKKYHFIKTQKQQNWMANYVREVWEILHQTVAIKTDSYREKIADDFIKEMSSYLKVQEEKIKKYISEIKEW